MTVKKEVSNDTSFFDAIVIKKIILLPVCTLLL